MNKGAQVNTIHGEGYEEQSGGVEDTPLWSSIKAIKCGSVSERRNTLSGREKGRERTYKNAPIYRILFLSSLYKEPVFHSVDQTSQIPAEVLGVRAER